MASEIELALLLREGERLVRKLIRLGLRKYSSASAKTVKTGRHPIFAVSNMTTKP